MLMEMIMLHDRRRSGLRSLAIDSSNGEKAREAITGFFNTELRGQASFRTQSKYT
jgi:hypothetical protein